HRASWVKIFERRFSGDSNNTAYLIEQDYVVVTQQLRQYSSLWSAASRGRDLPLTEIEISTVTTPPPENPIQYLIVPGNRTAFWICAGGSPFRFHMRGRDKDLSVEWRMSCLPPKLGKWNWKLATRRYWTIRLRLRSSPV